MQIERFLIHVGLTILGLACGSYIARKKLHFVALIVKIFMAYMLPKIWYMVYLEPVDADQLDIKANVLVLLGLMSLPVYLDLLATALTWWRKYNGHEEA